MTSEYYFFDQFSRASRIGGVDRSKRDSDDFNQALYHVKVALSIEDDQSVETENLPLISIKKQTGDILLPTILRQLKQPILPEILTKELDTILQSFDDQSSLSIDQLKSSDEENELINPWKISLPSSLILQLHSTWSDLIKNTKYNYKVWRTKAGEETWRQYVQRKRSQRLNLKKQDEICETKPIVRRRTSSRVSLASITNLSHRQSLTTNSKPRLSRSFSRASFLTISNSSQDNLRLLKAMHQGTLENVFEPIKNGIHVEYKLSTQNENLKQKIVLFETPKLEVNVDEDISSLNKCKRLLTETKQKILETTNQQNKKCRIWFYEDNQFMRNKNNIGTLNELNRRQKSKFVLAILRHEIPEKYRIHMDIPQTKHKSYIELSDGSIQIYYPSGRLAVLRLRPPFFTTLFFDDTDSTTNQFLGLVTSTGNVILMQPTFHARFITNNQDEHVYLCNGKTGIIEKEFQWNLINNCLRQSSSIDEDNINSSEIFESTIQLQINSFMQLEYHNPSNILFEFTCQNEEFQFQLGIHLPIQSSLTLMNLTTTILTTKKISGEKKSQLSVKRSNSNETSNSSEKQQSQTRKLSGEQTHFHRLPMMEELILLRKRIKYICESWLKEYRTTLGIMDIDAYCLSDLPSPSSSQPMLKQTKQRLDDINCRTSATQLSNVPTLTKRTSWSNEFAKSIDRQQLFQKDLTEKLESNVIANSIEEFLPHSDTGRAIKQRIYSKKILPTTLPVIKITNSHFKEKQFSIND